MTNYPNCPYCGSKQRDIAECFNELEGCLAVECDNCGKKIIICRSASFYYSAYIEEPMENSNE